MSDSDDLTPPELREIAENITLLPEKSKHTYEQEYVKFQKWCDENNVKVITENVMIAYFQLMKITKRPSTIWRCYSILNTMINIKKNINISEYLKMKTLLKRFSEGYQPKKSKILQSDEVIKFITKAPDDKYLATKVALIIGFCGACRREEICHLSTDDITYKNDSILISVPKTKTNVPRLFAITDVDWIVIIKKYASLRPVHTKHNRFFLTYKNSTCTVQPIGINKIGQMAKTIAAYLQLPEPELYLGHCFRRSSASHIANHGGDLMTIKRHGGWKSSTVAEGYIDASLQKKIDVANLLSSNLPSTSTSGLPAAEPSISGPCRNVQVITNNEDLNMHNLQGITINVGANSTVNINVYNNSST